MLSDFIGWMVGSLWKAITTQTLVKMYVTFNRLYVCGWASIVMYQDTCRQSYFSNSYPYDSSTRMDHTPVGSRIYYYGVHASRSFRWLHSNSIKPFLWKLISYKSFEMATNIASMINYGSRNIKAPLWYDPLSYLMAGILKLRVSSIYHRQ